MMTPRFSAILVSCLVLLMASAAAGAGRKAMSVQVKQGQVRATPSFLGKILATLSYGDRVEVLENKDSWIKIVPAGKGPSGWMHSSALTEKRIVLKAGGKETEVAASGGELALAGKGFNADVEAEFRKQHKDIDFSWIDRMQAIKVPPEKISVFLREGGLAPAQGGGK
jgi:SH3-like domain-containing protein